MTCVNLKPNWKLLDSNFESYKLSLEQLAVYSVKLDNGPDVLAPQADDFSFQRIKLLSFYNYLITDPWNSGTSYYVDQTGKVKQCCVSVETSIPKPRSVYQLQHYYQGKYLPISISFPSSDLCLLVDDTGHISVVSTGDRKTSQNEKWERVFECNVGGSGCNTIILNSRQRNDATIDVAILKFQDKQSETQVFLEWVKITNKDCTWSIDEQKLFKTSHVPYFVGFSIQSNAIHIASQAKVTVVSDWDEDVTEISDKHEDMKYVWKQSDDDVTISITLPGMVSKEHIACNIKANSVEIGTKMDQNIANTLMQGELCHNVDPQLCTWTVSDDILEVTLQKSDQGQCWEYLISGDADREIHDDITMQDARGFQPAGLDRYEDCDDLPDASSVLYCLDGDHKKFTHEASLASNQWLFNCCHDQESCFVLRHDVDALMWTCDNPHGDSKCPWSHVSTFNALGYVKASKQDVKYANCSSNASFAALCESMRRVFVYHTSTAASAPLRNRLTGKQAHLSKQQVVTLPSNDPICGFHTADDMIFVLTKNELFVIKMSTPQS